MDWTDLASQLNCHVFCGKRNSSGFSDIYNKSYQFWFEIWSKTFKEVINLQHLFSDEWVRQDEILALTFKDKVIGLIFFDFVSAENPAHMNHSYFKFFSNSFTSDIAALSHKNLMVMSNLTVDPDWRQSSSNFPTSKILLGLALKRFQNSSSDTIICFTRNDRKTDALVYGLGGRPLESGILAYDIPSDIAIIDRSGRPDSATLILLNAINPIWLNRNEDDRNKKVRTYDLTEQKLELAYVNNREINQF